MARAGSYKPRGYLDTARHGQPDRSLNYAAMRIFTRLKEEASIDINEVNEWLEARKAIVTEGSNRVERG